MWDKQNDYKKDNLITWEKNNGTEKKKVREVGRKNNQKRKVILYINIDSGLPEIFISLSIIGFKQ